jgi:hypothetical protein
MRKRFNPGRRTAGPAAYGRYGVPTVPVPIPIFAAAALLAAFSLGRKSEKLRLFGGGPLGHKPPEVRRTTSRWVRPPQRQSDAHRRRRDRQSVDGP